MTDPSRPFDKGLQPERTALSWQRTTLALAVGLLVTVRLLAHLGSSLTLPVAGAGLVLTVAVFVTGFRRYRSVHATLTSSGGERVAFHSALPLLVWAVVSFGLGMFGLVALAFGLVHG